MKRVVVAITGASGSIYAQRLITKLLKINDQWSNLALVLSDNAHQVWTEEIGPVNFNDWGIPIFDKRDFNAPFASGFWENTIPWSSSPVQWEHWHGWLPACPTT